MEQGAITKYGISVDTLMQRAGQATFRALRETWPEAQNIIVLCGKGNNAGDGYVVAKCAHEAGLQVKVLSLVEFTELKGAAYDAALACSNCGVDIHLFANNELHNSKVDVIIDALLGTGLRGNIQQNYCEAILAINAMHVPVIAVDVPSGLHSDTGWTEQDNTVVKAQLTVTFIGLKSGLFTGKAAEFCGKIICDDLDLPAEIFMSVKANAVMLDLPSCLAYLPARSRYAHKGNYGHVLVVGGDYGMGGAVRMAAEAAARTGAGLVSVATRSEHILAVNAARPEIMCHGIENAQDLLPLLTKATCVVIGPGLGTSSWGRGLWQEVMRCDNLPLVVDADALNLLAEFYYEHVALFVKRNWILTPHPGEAAKLLNVDANVIQNDRYSAISQLQQNYGGIVVLKGSGSLIKDNDKLVGVCSYGNPGMASGGMGDVLSGILGGLCAQGLGVEKVTQLGVCIHAKAADLAAIKDGERGLLAMDLLPYVRALLNMGATTP